MSRVLNPIVSESYMNRYIESEGYIKPSGSITITENGQEIDVSRFATADVDVSDGGWITITNGTYTSEYNSYYQTYLCQIEVTQDPSSPVLKVTLDNNVYYLRTANDVNGSQGHFWVLDDVSLLLSANIVNEVAYWGLLIATDTEPTQHTIKIETDENYYALVSKSNTNDVRTLYLIEGDLTVSEFTTGGLWAANYGATVTASGTTVTNHYAYISQGIQ